MTQQSRDDRNKQRQKDAAAHLEADRADDAKRIAAVLLNNIQEYLNPNTELPPLPVITERKTFGYSLLTGSATHITIFCAHRAALEIVRDSDGLKNRDAAVREHPSGNFRLTFRR